MSKLAKHDQETEFEEYAWTVAEAVTSSVAAATGIELVSSLGKIGTHLDTRKALRMKLGGLEPNPHFVSHGIDSGGGTSTLRYFVGRAAKSTLGTGLGFVSKAATTSAVVDVGGIVKEGQAAALSAVHAA